MLINALFPDVHTATTAKAEKREWWNCEKIKCKMLENYTQATKSLHEREKEGKK